MKSLFLQVLMLASLCLAPLHAEPPRLLTKTPVLPLALDDAIQFRKTITFFCDPRLWKPTQEDMINLDRQRVFYGAVTQFDRLQRFGNYYTFEWRALRKAEELTIRFEYRQEKLGAFVQAQEHTYRDVKGSLSSKFSVVGDDYFDEGRVTAWRAIVIEKGKIVALNQSFLWR